MPDEPKNEELAPVETTAPTQPFEPVQPVDTPIIQPAAVAVEPTPTVIGSGPAVDATLTPAPNKSRKKAIIIGAIVAGAIIVLGGGGASAYFLWYQNPNKVVTDALVHAMTAKTVAVTGTIELKNDDYEIKLEASGRNSLEANSTFGAKLTFSSDDVKYTVDGEAVYSAEGDIYVKVKDVQGLVDSFEKQSDGAVSFDAFSSVIKKIDGNWIKIGKEDLGDYSEDYEKAQKCLADVSKSLDSDASFRKTVQNETEKLYKENQFILISDSIGSRTIGGQGSLGYTLSGDRDKADAFFTAFESTRLGTKIKDCDNSIKFADLIPEADKSDTKDTSKTTIELWVSRFGHEITEVNVKGSDDDANGTIVINPIFNKNETVEIPKDSIGVKELQADIEAAYEDLYGSYEDTDYTTTDVDVNTNVNYN